MSSDQRLILYHKHSVSGRTLFLNLDGRVCQFEGISSASQVVDSHVGGDQVKEDLSELLADAEQRLGMSKGSLTLDREFIADIEDADIPLHVYLARFTAIDPLTNSEPFATQQSSRAKAAIAIHLVTSNSIRLGKRGLTD
jgi:hypothetical protein